LRKELICINFEIKFESNFQCERGLSRVLRARAVGATSSDGVLSEPTCGLGDGSDDDGRNGEYDAADGGRVRHELSATWRLGRQHSLKVHLQPARQPAGRCSIKYLTVPNSSQLRHCACAISQSLARRCLFNIYFFGYVTFR